MTDHALAFAAKLEPVLPLPSVVVGVWRAQQALQQYYVKTGLKFTIDGRLLGDIAEALALGHFGLALPDQRIGGVDAYARDGRSVQIKATGKVGCGPSFTFGKGIASHLLFFHLDLRSSEATILYNGPEAPVRSLLPLEWKGTKSVPLIHVRTLARQTHPADKLPLL